MKNNITWKEKNWGNGKWEIYSGVLIKSKQVGTKEFFRVQLDDEKFWIADNGKTIQIVSIEEKKEIAS